MAKSAYAAAGLAVLALGAAGCGSSNNKSSSSAASTPPATKSTPATTTQASGGGAAKSAVAVGETEYKITPSNATAKSGTVTIAVKNSGAITHNLNVEGNGIDKKTADISAGAGGKLVLNLKPGTYEMYCSIDGHRGLGMQGKITVT